MAKKTPVEKFASTIQKILAEYGESVEENLSEATQKMAKKGAQAVRQNAAAAFGSGRYARGWKSQVDVGRLFTRAVIYNRSLPGLPHLLEHGHAKRNGGRTAATVHIEPVADLIENEFIREVKRTI